MKRLPLVLCVALGCGGAGKDGPTTPGSGGGGGSASKPAAAGDVSLELAAIKIEGLIFEPEALGRPGMPATRPRGNITIAKQQALYNNAKNPVDKQAYGVQLVTLMYDEAKKLSGPAQQQMVLDCRKLTRDLIQIGGANPDELVLLFSGTFEIETLVTYKDGDWAIAEKSWEQLVQKFPKNKNILGNKAWWAYTLLKQYKNAAALDAIKGDTLTPKEPEHAYVVGWTKWRAGDDAGAWQAMTVAAEGWGNNPGKDVIQRDLLLFAGRSSVPLAQVLPKLYQIFGAKIPADQYAVAAKLGLQAYRLAGKWQEAVDAIQEAFKLAGATVPADDKVALKFYAALSTVPLDQPAAAARFSIEAIQAMPGCPAPKCSDKEKQDAVQGIYGIGRVFHLLYATANDIRYYQPAHDIYTETIPLIKDNALRTQAKADMTTLETTLKNTKVGTGTHEKQAMSVLIDRHSQEVQTCYEAVLAGNPKLAGTLTLNLESDATGDIKGASTDPKAGASDMSLVAQCVQSHAKGWKLPKRGMAGTTRIKVTYQLSKKP
jgi:tetratricopeptide (TPR) repeat protein